LLRKKYLNSKAYAENAILKYLHSKAEVWNLHTMLYARNDPPGTLIEPGQLNRRLANDTRYTLKNDALTGNEDSTSSTGNFLHPRDLRERVLEKNVDWNILAHLEGKKNISAHKSKIKEKHTKAHENQNIEDRGGFPSAYVISDEIMQIRSIAGKTGAANYIRERMNLYGLGYDLAKYLMEALFHAAKMDKGMLPLIIGIGTRMCMNNDLAESEISEIQTFSQSLQSISDSDIEILADNAAKLLIADQGYNEMLIFVSTFIRNTQ
jgi:hypothetical protein